MEHWLPFDYETLETSSITCPAPPSRSITRPRSARRPPRNDQRFLRRARQSPPREPRRAALSPGPPEQLSSTREWRRRSRAAVVQLSPLRGRSSGTPSMPAPGRRRISPRHAPTRSRALRGRARSLEAEQKSGRRSRIAAYSAGSAERLQTRCARARIADLRGSPTAAAQEACCGRRRARGLPVENGTPSTIWCCSPSRTSSATGSRGRRAGGQPRPIHHRGTAPHAGRPRRACRARDRPL